MAILQDYSSSNSFKFSIITPLYNRITYLKEWLLSLLRQNHQASTEILLMDDCSTIINRNDIEVILWKYEQEIRERKYVFHYFRQSENQGEYQNVNMGLKMANGEWVYLLHDDDLVLDDAFLEWENVIDKYADADLITARFCNINTNNEITFESPELESEGWVGDKFKNNFIYGNPLHPNSTIFHKELFHKIGYFADDIRFYADWEYWRRASKADVKWCYLPKTLCYYREHTNTESFEREQERFGENFWRMVERSKEYYTNNEFYISKFYQYQNVFQYLDEMWANHQFSNSLKIIYNIIIFSDMSDGIGLDCITKISIKYKEEIVKMFEVITQINSLFTKNNSDKLLDRFNNEKGEINTVSVAQKLAVQYHRTHRFTEAQQVYHQILEQQPLHLEALYGLGILAQQRGQPQDAEHFLNTAVQVQPDFAKAWFSLGNLYQAQGKLTVAVEAYQQAITLQPDEAPIYNNLGYALQQQGKFDEAVFCYKKALEFQPDCSEADVNLGNTLYSKGQLSPEQQAEYAALNNKLGFARKKVGDLKTASAYYRQAIALQPDLLEAHYNLGVVLQETGEFDSAIVCYQKALQLNPNYGEVYFNLGKIYQGQNHLKEAVAAYRQGLSLLNPDYAKAVAAYQDDETTQFVSVTPPIPQAEVTVGAYQFPAILPVAESEKLRPFWSVVIPIYNRSNYLLECLASVLAQWPGEEEMEILVIDNASTVPLAGLVNSIGGGIIRYYRNSRNLGLQGNFNTGVALSRGQWIHLLSDDDYVLPDFYSRLKQSLDGCSDSIGAAFTGYEFINEQGNVIGKGDVLDYYGEHSSGIAENWLRNLGVANPLAMAAVVIRRVAHERLGGYHPELAYPTDWELYKRIASFYDWWYESGILAHYRQHSQSETTRLLQLGEQAASLRHAVEISESYLPADFCSEITAKSRTHHFYYCLAKTAIPLKLGNVKSAFGLIQEAIKFDGSPQAVAKLFAWLSTDDAAPLRDEIVSKGTFGK